MGAYRDNGSLPFVPSASAFPASRPHRPSTSRGGGVGRGRARSPTRRLAGALAAWLLPARL